MPTRSIALLLGCVLLATLAAAQVTTKLIASGLANPLWAGAPNGDERIFIGLKGGQIRILQNGSLLPTPFLDIADRVSGGSEQGLLGVAFHPGYASNGFFFVNYTNLAGDTIVSRFSVSADPNVADPLSGLPIIGTGQPYTNHNGGDLHFGPDGYLYIFLGDGGSANDPGCRAQNLNRLLGKILRIDIDSASPYAIPPDNPFVGVVGALGHVYHYGLRNPWRNSFDRLTGDLYIGDVGQDLNEEIDFAPAGVGGLNFGWKVMEGTLCNQTTNCSPGIPLCDDPLYQKPITELLHSNGARCITGGYVYRGCAIPSEYGKYFYADYIDNKIRSLVYDPLTGMVSNLANRTAELAPGGTLAIRNIASFGEDGFGELLIIDESAPNGEVYKMVPATAVAASAILRNGSGLNRVGFSSASLPILGNVWEARVDVLPHAGATLTFLLGYSAPTSGVFFHGRELLVNTTSARLFRLVASSTGVVDVFRSNIPCDMSLSGLTAYVQALIAGGGLELCNALDVTVGSY